MAGNYEVCSEVEKRIKMRNQYRLNTKAPPHICNLYLNLTFGSPSEHFWYSMCYIDLSNRGNNISVLEAMKCVLDKTWSVSGFYMVQLIFW